jgi:hypothetical protein
MKRIFYILLILSGFQISAQKTQSLNLKKYKIAVLSDSLRESSGLTNINGRLFRSMTAETPAKFLK